MPFRRSEVPGEVPDEETLTAAMVGIGMAFSAQPDEKANIEDTLLFASMAAMDRHDLRVLGVLVTWFETHHAIVNADRLFKLVQSLGSERVQALWCALATWQAGDRRFARMQALVRGRRVDVLPAGTDFQIKRHGEDVRFADTCLRVPANVLRARPEDVMSPTLLSLRHRVYHYRVMMGPVYRADLWAALEEDPTLPAAELARRTYSSFASAWQVKRDFAILHDDKERPQRRQPSRGAPAGQ